MPLGKELDEYAEDAQSLDVGSAEEEKRIEATTRLGKEERFTVNINRQAYDQGTLDELYDYGKNANEESLLQSCTACMLPGDFSAAQRIKSLFPVIDTMMNYKWKQWLMYDIIAGISVGVIHIPQGMAFSLLAGLPAVYGLYSSLFPVVGYFVFGTSRHISFGTMAVISLFLVAVVDRETDRYAELTDNFKKADVWPSKDQIINMKVGVACAVSLLAGIIQVLMGTFHMGVIASFMSTPFIGGFMTGAGFHITTSQLPSLLGLKLPKIEAGMGRIPRSIASICTHIGEVNIAELVISILCVGLLTFFKEFINVRYAKQIKVPIPAELIAVTLAICISYFGDLHGNYDVNIIGNVPSGLPSPTMPLMDNALTYITDAILVAVLSFVISVSMAKMFAAKHKYTIDADQELRAYGISHIFGSFFQSFAGAQAPPRSLVHDAAGGKTQLASIFSVLLVLLACTVAAPLVEPLPKAVLASVIVVALFPLFKAFADLPRIWRTGRYDFAVWLSTWLVTTLVTVTAGLVAGLAISCLTVIAHSRLVDGYTLGETEDGIYVRLDRYRKAKSKSGLHVFRYPSMIYFANLDRFIEQLYTATVDPRRTPPSTGGATKQHGAVVVLDCSEVSYVDAMLLTKLYAVRGAYDRAGVEFALACVNRSVVSRLRKVADESAVPPLQCYVTIQDAVAKLTKYDNENVKIIV